MQYIYDGLLTEHVASSVKTFAQKYPFPVELAEMPPDWSEWNKVNLTDYTQSHRTCAGQECDRVTKLYGLVRREKGQSLFLFLKSLEEWCSVVRAFPGLVVNEKPFKTLIG